MKINHKELSLTCLSFAIFSTSVSLVGLRWAVTLEDVRSFGLFSTVNVFVCC